ncbi:MAG TPA: KamA family radical SAM protein, partial [Candidatus Methanofastidiosa archaeon]|nr:KamA family radical SAM protein [Candidatus Methanofastidiosa archaeon]
MDYIGCYKYQDGFDLKEELENNVRTIDELEEHLVLGEEESENLREITRLHPMSITRYYLSLIDPNDINDPIRKMSVPTEGEFSQGGMYDTSGEKDNTVAVGLQHKYKQTALVLLTHRCSVYCRFCFRKRLVGRSESEIISNINAARDYIEQHEEITNVLLSGGDPLVLENHIIEHFLKTFIEIDHINFIRVGTRVPVVMPHRIYGDRELLDIFDRYSTPEKRINIVSHFNHPKEINKYSALAIDKLMDCGMPIQNQTVLLGGVNDNPNVMAELMRNLVRVGVNPYYIFQCRPVRRALHFQVPISRGLDVVEDSKRQLCGIAKRFKYVMSHIMGKIEIVAKDENYLYFKQHQAKDPSM